MKMTTGIAFLNRQWSEVHGGVVLGVLVVLLVVVAVLLRKAWQEVATLSLKEDELLARRRDCETYEGEIARLQKDETERKQVIAILEERGRQLGAEVTSLRESQIREELSHESLRQEFQRVNAGMEESLSEKEELADRLRNTEAESGKLSADICGLKERLQAREDELGKARNSESKLVSELEAGKEKNENLKDELSTLKERVEGLSAELHGRDNRLEEVSLEIGIAKEENDKLQSELRRALMGLKESETRIENFKERESFLENELLSDAAKIELQAEKIELLRGDLEVAEKEMEISENRLENEREKLGELREQFREQKEALTGEFKVLSESILKARQKELGKTSQEGIQALLAPLKEEIGGFKKRVERVHSESIDGQGQMKEQLKSLREMNSQLTERAENLTNALRNDKKTLGNWGEIQLERLLENAGLDQGMYRREANYKTDEGNNQRPDFIVDLPEGKCLIIDSKVTLNAYVDSANANTEEERLAHLKQHTTNMRNHIRNLAEKGYDSLAGLNSPDFIFMFMPVESAYLAAFEEDASLFDYAYEKKVAVVTPNTLLPILRTVQSLWRIDRQNKGTDALAHSAAKVHKKLMTFLERFEDLEKKMGSLQGAFEGAKSVLTTGRGNLIRLASDFENQGVKVSKTVPKNLMKQVDEVEMKI